MSNFLIKKLGHQELGYKNKYSQNPGVSRGQYFLVSKNYLEFFPELSKYIPQDLEILNIVTHDSDYPVQAKYIYDNDKFHGSKANSPRNEHRINLTLKINPNKEVFLKDDIIIFKKEEFLNEDEDQEEAYVITRYRESENPTDYHNLLELMNLKKKDIRSKNYVLVPTEDLNFIKNFRTRLFSRVMSLNPIIPTTDSDLLKLKGLQGSSVKMKNHNQLQMFEKQIKRIVFGMYDYKCIASKIGYKWNELNGVKTTWKGITGAHIKPRSHGGEYSSENIIPLLEPIHQLFDRGIFTISLDYKIELHKRALEDPLLSNFHDFHEKKLNIPSGIELSQECINHHRKEVFGNFVIGKQIRSL